MTLATRTAERFDRAGYVSTGWVVRNVDGISERRIHHWRASGAITPSYGGNNPGSGRAVRWSPRDVQRLRALGRFCDAVETFAHAASIDAIRRIWRGLESVDEIELGDGNVSIVVTLDPSS